MKRGIIPFLILACLLLSRAGAYAQFSGSGGSQPPKIEKISVFGEQHTEVTPDTSVSEGLITSAMWVTKCNPVVFFRGEVPVYLERRLNSRFSLEGAAGITFNDFFKTSVLESKPLFQKDPNVNYLSGFTGKLSLHYFPGRNALTGLYFSPEIDFKNYRKDVSGVYLNTDGRYTSGKLRDQQNYFDVKAIVGFQKTDDISHDFYFDWYLGAGLRTGYEDNVVADEKNANVIKVNHTDILTPVITLGVKIGLGL